MHTLLHEQQLSYCNCQKCKEFLVTICAYIYILGTHSHCVQNACDSDTMPRWERGQRTNSFFLLLPVWMKEDNTVLPKRSHSLVYCQILQNILRPSGLTSELLYCPWHIGCCRCDRMDRSSILRGRIWPMHTAYTLTQVPLRYTSTPLPHSFYITAAVTGYFSDKDFTWKKTW